MAYKDLTFLLFAKDMNVKEAFGGVTREADRMHAGISGSMAGIGLAVAGASLALAAGSIKMAADFESATTRLVTDAGTKASDLGKVQAGILAISEATGTSATDTAKGMYVISSAGFTGAAGLEVLHAATEGAKVGYSDLGTTADALTVILRDFAGKHAPTATEAMNAIIATVSHGKTTVEDLAGSLHNVLPQANIAGLSLQQVLGAMATMTGEGISADQASQNLNHAIGALASPSQVAADAMANVGLSSLDVAKNLGKRGLTGTYDVLTHAIATHMKGGTVALNLYNTSAQAAASMKSEIAGLPAPLRSTAEAFAAGHVTGKEWAGLMKQQPATVANLGKQFSTTVKHAEGFNSAVKSGQGPARTFLGQLDKMTGGMVGAGVAAHLTGDHMKDFKGNVNVIGDALHKNGKHVTDWGVLQKTLNFQLEKAKTAFGDAGVKIGTALLPALKVILPEIPKVADAIAKLAPVFTQIAKVVVHVTENFIYGGKQWMDFFKWVGATTQERVKVITGAIAGIGKWWHDTVDAFGVGAGQLNGFFHGVEGWFRDLVGKFGDGAKQIGDFIGGVVKNFQDGGKQIVGAFSNAGQWLLDAGKNIVDGLVNGIQGAWHFVTDAVNSLASLIPAGVRKILGIASPSKVFHQIGTHVGEGLRNGLLGSVDQVKAAASQLSTAVVAQFKSGAIGKEAEHVALTSVTRMSLRLQGLAKQRDAVNASLTNLRTDRTNVTTGVRTSTLGQGNITGFAAVGDAVEGLQVMIRNTKQFKGDLYRLRRMGVGQTMFRQLVDAWQSDPANALRTANELIANPVDLKEIVGLQRQLGAASLDLGNYAGAGEYGAAINQRAGQSRVLTWEMQRTAESGLRRVASETHIHVHLAGTYAGTKTDLAKTVYSAFRDAVKQGAIPKNAYVNP